jgi:cell volume regulation protein A
VPIVLAVFPLMAGVAAAPLLFEFAFVVALTSLLLQGTTVAAAARIFRVTLPPRAAPVARVALDPLDPATGSFSQYRVHRDCPLRGAHVASIDWPPGARLVSVVRSDALLAPGAAGVFQTGDLAGFIAEPAADAELSGWFGANAAEAWHRAFGDFEFAATTRFGDVAAFYGRGPAPAGLAQLTLEQAMKQALGRAVTAGDAAEVGGLRLCVSEMDGASIARVALRLPRNDQGAD